MAYLKSCKVNFVRIQIKVPVRAKAEKISVHEAFTRELQWADSIMVECKKNKMTSLLAFNHLVFDTLDLVTDKSEKFWDGNTYLNRVYLYLDTIASYFKSKGTEFSAYEIIGEPAIAATESQKGRRPDRLEEFYKRALSIIRKHDSERFFLVTPGPWGRPSSYKDFAGFNLNDSRIIYGAHMYMPHEYTHQGVHGRKTGKNYPGFFESSYFDRKRIEQLFNLIMQFSNQHNNAPVYIGEFSVARWADQTDQYLADVIQTAEACRFSWSYFTYKSGFEMWDPFYDAPDPGQRQLKYTGDKSSTWQLLLKSFSKNRFYGE